MSKIIEEVKVEEVKVEQVEEVKVEQVEEFKVEQVEEVKVEEVEEVKVEEVKGEEVKGEEVKGEQVEEVEGEEVEEVKVEQVKVEQVKVEQVEEVKGEEVKDMSMVEVKNTNDILTQTFVQLFENFLKNHINLNNFDVIITPEIQCQLLLLCKEAPELFDAIKTTLNKILIDNRINAKDIPDALSLVGQIHTVVVEKKLHLDDPYEFIKISLHLAFVIYMDTNNIKNPEVIVELLKIVDASIDLIKLVPIIQKKTGCFSRLFCKH